MQIEVLESSNPNVLKHNHNKQEQEKTESNPTIEDLPESKITKLDDIDSFPDLTKESNGE